MVCRTEMNIPKNMKKKIALYCNVREENVIENLTASNLYEVPLMLEKQGLAKSVCEKLKLKNIKPQNSEWEKMVEKILEIKEILQLLENMLNLRIHICQLLKVYTMQDMQTMLM